MFSQFKLDPSILRAVSEMKWETPTPVQRACIPLALEGKDICAAAQTGTGKTGAFVIPIVQKLIAKGMPSGLAVILAPTRELASQISDVVRETGKHCNVTVSTIYGGMDPVKQMAEISKDPNVIVATPGRFAQLLTETKGFSLDGTEMIVFDEADNMFGPGFFDDVRIIMKFTPNRNQTMLFSATMPKEIKKLTNLLRIEPESVLLSKKIEVARTLSQEMLAVREERKEPTLVVVLNEMKDASVIVFVSTCRYAQIYSDMVSNYGIPSLCITGKMTQEQRDEVLKAFRAKEARVLFSTNVVARGIDIPDVDAVIHFDMPSSPKEYVHRAGRAGRANNAGESLVFVTREDLKEFARLENYLKKKLPARKIDQAEVDAVMKQVDKAKDMAVEKYKKESRA